MSLTGNFIRITGIVQGVGFRPFVYGLAQHFGINGWVRNTTAGVEIAIDGTPPTLEAFSQALVSQAPPLANIHSIAIEPCPPGGFTRFEILHSEPIEGAFQPISPDVTTCPDCLRELNDPTNRRYRYPFINCTNCGPRFTIISDIPYDRPNTTMAGFMMCPVCRAEYEDPLDRRFHAQPVACPECGPQIWIEWNIKNDPTIQDAFPGIPLSQNVEGDLALLVAQKLLAAGKILAIKGLGGFHLACDATNPITVAELRRRKLRVDKPFALMASSTDEVQRHCRLSPQERQIIESRARPVVILDRHPASPVTPDVAPGQHTLGMMLPYTPLHTLLFASHPLEPSFKPVQVLVMTSGNLSEEPIATENDEARRRLSVLADAFLMHDRPIYTRCDDSVVHGFAIRRSRGYAPSPIRLSQAVPPILAGGAELKNTFCLANGPYAFLSHHIGDLQNYETLSSFEAGITHLERLYRIQPELLAYDLHPNYLATRYILDRAARQQIRAVGVQHHHAHIAACMAEHSLLPNETVIGVAFDGTGYGDDGAIWGGEILLCSYEKYSRLGHLEYLPLPGGDAAIHHPARIALAALWHAHIEWHPELAPVKHYCAADRNLLRSQLEHAINTPLTSSMGRLFDAAAALSGVRQSVNYEAQAAIEFEALADEREQDSYPFEIKTDQAAMVISTTQLLEHLTTDVLSALPIGRISARFHNSIANMVGDCVRLAYNKSGIRQVVLSGGVWQNVLLLRKTEDILRNAGFIVYTHHDVPPNDGGLALGQAVIAAGFHS